MKLSLKFLGALLAVLLTALAGAAWWLFDHQRDAIHEDAKTRALTVLSFGEACRQYARDVLSPKVREHTNKLIFEADSATFVARGTFEFFREKHPDYSFREAALNPLNLVNRADAHEEKLIRQFQADETMKEITGFRPTDSGEVFFVARPIVVKHVCLRCHDSPATAPPEVVTEYGSTHGFGWKEGDRTSAIIVTVPASDIQEEQRAALWTVLAIFGGLAAGLMLVSYLLFNWLVKHRLARLGDMMAMVAADPLAQGRLHDPARDELGGMALAFNRMADSLRQNQLTLEQRVEDRTAALANANHALEREIGERVRAEGEIQHAARELARSNAELEQFAYVASHDLQEPLRMVASYVQLLAERYRDRIDDKAERWIQFTVDGTARMKQLIDDLLELSRVGRGKPFAPTDCGQVLQAARANLDQAIRDSGAVVTHGPLPTVWADTSQLTQVFQNLLANALKYRSAQPPEIDVRAEELPDEWRFSIRDNGIGIDPAYAERIFVVFQRLHTRAEYPGTGIGLALCKKVIERHGGRIWVESQPGQGATFHFTLPKNPRR